MGPHELARGIVVLQRHAGLRGERQGQRRPRQDLRERLGVVVGQLALTLQPVNELHQIVAAQLDDPQDELFTTADERFVARLRRYGDDGWATFSCPSDKVAALADWLILRGAVEVTVASLDYVFSATNRLHEKLLARLG